MKNIFVIALIAVSLGVSCKEEEPKLFAVEQCRNDGQSRFSTLILIVVSVRLEDQQGSPIALDRFTVTGGDYFAEEIPSEWQQTNGQYTIFSDTDAERIEVGGSDFLFRGIINERVVINEVYTVGFDCCHVFLQSDNDTTRINSLF